MISNLSNAINQFYLKNKKISLLRVLNTEKITPRVQRIHFYCEDIEQYNHSEKLHIRLILPPEKVAAKDWLNTPANTKLKKLTDNYCIKRYTIRQIDTQQQRITIDFVLHTASIFCPGADWAAHASEGFTIGMIGPGVSDIKTADWYVLAGDETALPAIGRTLESLDHNATGEIFIEVHNKDEKQNLLHPDTLNIHWLYRNGIDAKNSLLLYNAIEQLKLKPEACNPFIWVAGEVGVCNKIRTMAKRKFTLDKKRVQIAGHWQ